MTALAFQVTGLWDAGADVVDYLGQILDPVDGEVQIPVNDSRSASVTFSVYDPVAAALEVLPQIPYMAYLRVYYCGIIVFWGPVKVRTVDSAAGTVRLDAVDQTVRLIRHALRRGDLAGGDGGIELTAANGDQGWVTADHRGIRKLRNAADTETFPPLGIADGVNALTTDSSRLVQVSRGDQPYEKILEIAAAAGAEIDWEPVDDQPGVYCLLNTYLPATTARGMVLHYGCGLDNVENVTFSEGEQYTNLVHVVDSDGKFRATVIDAVALTRTGPYVDWVSAGYGAAEDAVDDDTRALLQSTGEAILRNQGRPLQSLTVTMPPDSDTGNRFLRDYFVGDIVAIAAKAAEIDIPESLYRVVRVTPRQDGQDGQVRPDLEVVPFLEGVTYDTDDDTV